MCYKFTESVKYDKIHIQILDMSNIFTDTRCKYTILYTRTGARNVLLFNKSHNNFSAKSSLFSTENKVEFVTSSQIFTFSEFRYKSANPMTVSFSGSSSGYFQKYPFEGYPEAIKRKLNS